MYPSFVSKKEPQPSPIGRRARGIRTSLGLTQKQVQEATGIRQGYISQLERGDIQDPGATTLAALAECYGVSILDFFTETTSEQLNSSLQEFLDSPMARDVTDDEVRTLSGMQIPRGRPTALTWYHLLVAIRSTEEAEKEEE